MVLVNSSLSSQPIYTMGFYSLTDYTHKKMDTIKSRFFWRGTSDKFKHHMMRWGAICWPKDYGGLRVINIRLMNDCLMTKWFWKIASAREEL